MPYWMHDDSEMDLASSQDQGTSVEASFGVTVLHDDNTVDARCVHGTRA